MVRILRSSRPLPVAPGSSLTAGEADQLEGDWIATTGPDRAEDADPPSAGLCYYTPLVMAGDTLTVGHTAVLSRVADPTELRAARTGGPGDGALAASRVLLRWRWAPDASATRLIARQGSSVNGHADTDSIVINVTRTDYERQGSWTIDLPLGRAATDGGPRTEPAAGGPPQPRLEQAVPEQELAAQSSQWYISAYSVAELDGGDIVSPGLEPTSKTSVPGPHPQVTVTYSLKPPWLPRGPWTLTLRTEPKGSAIPQMVLVANQRAVPLSAEDGEIVARLPAGHDGTTHRIRTSLNLAQSCSCVP